MKPVTVTQPQPPDEEIAAEVLATAIVAVAQSARALLASRLSPRAICMLIRQGCPAAERPTLAQIETVLKTAADLERLYIKPEHQKKRNQSRKGAA